MDSIWPYLLSEVLHLIFIFPFNLNMVVKLVSKCLIWILHDHSFVFGMIIVFPWCIKLDFLVFVHSFLDFAQKYNLSNFLQVSNLGLYMIWSFQWNTTLNFYFSFLTYDFEWKYSLSNLFPSMWYEFSIVIAF